MFKIGVWETFVKTKRKVTGTDATKWYCSAHFIFQNLIIIRLVWGIKLDKEESKLSVPADNLALILQDLKSKENALKLLDDFSRYSGLSINIEKQLKLNT